jgi:hypothetical protein
MLQKVAKMDEMGEDWQLLHEFSHFLHAFQKISVLLCQRNEFAPSTYQAG